MSRHSTTHRTFVACSPGTWPYSVLLLVCLLLTTKGASAITFTSLTCASIPNTNSTSYETDITCAATIQSPPGASWISVVGQNCTTACASRGLINQYSADGFKCTSGEERPKSAIGVVDFTPTGCWHSCSLPEGITGAVSVGGRCYAPGQKRDNDRTDTTVGCFCAKEQSSPEQLALSISTSGSLTLRALSGSQVGLASQSSLKLNDQTGRLFDLRGAIAAASSATLTMQIHASGKCGTKAIMSGAVALPDGTIVQSKEIAVALPACPVTQCSDGIDNNKDGSLDALHELSAENGQSLTFDPGTDPGVQFSLRIADIIKTKKLPLTAPGYFNNKASGILRADNTGWAIAGSSNPIGTPALSTLTTVCRILGYREYVSSTCRDDQRSAMYPHGKCNFHSPTDNYLWRFNGTDFKAEVASPQLSKSWITSITCKNALPACSDGWDNDGDGRVDTADDGCASPLDNDERPHDPTCSGSLDQLEGTWTPSCVKSSACPALAITQEATKLDVNKDCILNRDDATTITNHINAGGGYLADYDVNGPPGYAGDGSVSPLDVLTIADFLNGACPTPTSSPTSTPTSTATPSATATPTSTVPTSCGDGSEICLIVNPINVRRSGPQSKHEAKAYTGLGQVFLPSQTIPLKRNGKWIIDPSLTNSPGINIRRKQDSFLVRIHGGFTDGVSKTTLESSLRLVGAKFTRFTNGAGLDPFEGQGDNKGDTSGGNDEVFITPPSATADISSTVTSGSDNGEFFIITGDSTDGSATDTPTNTPTMTPTPTPTGSLTSTPTHSPTASHTNTPTATPTGSLTSTPTDTPVDTSTMTPTATPTGSLTSTPTHSPTASHTNTPTATPTGSLTSTPTDTPVDTSTMTPTATPTGSLTSTPTHSPTASHTDTPTATPTGALTSTPTNTPVDTSTMTPTATPTGSLTSTPTHSPTASHTDTPTATPTGALTSTPTNTPVDTSTMTPTATPTGSLTSTPTHSPTASHTNTPTATPTGSLTSTPTDTPVDTSTMTPTATPTGSLTATPTYTPSQTPKVTPTGSLTTTPTNSPTATLTNTPTATPTGSLTATPTSTPTHTPTKTPTVTPTGSLTATPTSTPTHTPTTTPTASPTATASPVWPDDVPLIVFVSSIPFDLQATYDGERGGIEAANAFCRQRAQAGGLVTIYSSWRALISTSAQDVRDLTGQSSSSGAVLNRRDEVLTANRATLWDETTVLNHAPQYDEFNNLVSATVATASDARGIKLSTSTCQDFTDPGATISNAGSSSNTSRAWVSAQLQTPLSCANIRIYCVGNTAQPQPTRTPTTTPSQTPSATPTQTPAAGTPTQTPTSSPTSFGQGSTPTSSPTATSTRAPTSTATPNPTGAIGASTPTPTPTVFAITTAVGQPGQVSGKISSGGRAIPGALIYAPQIVNVAISDKSGSWTIEGIDPTSSKITIKVRSTQLANSGFDLPVSAGTTFDVTNVKTQNYNPYGCKETDHLLSLYNAALKIRAIYLMAVSDHRILSTGKNSGSIHESGRALLRAAYHAQTYFELSALLPDRELLCTSNEQSCAAVSLSKIRRTMRQSATHLRLESLLFNRKLRLIGGRTDEESKKRINSIRTNYKRITTMIEKLPRGSFDCSAIQRAVTQKTASPRKGSKNARRRS